MCDNNNQNCNCISEILKVICILQNEVCQGDSCLETCTKAYFGTPTSTTFNTRPVTLYTCNTGSTPLTMPISRDPAVTTTSNVFRLEKLDDSCATFRVLAPNTETTSNYPYEATNSFFTINLNCVCIIRCLDDTFVECI